MNYFDDIIPLEIWINHILPHLNFREILNLNTMNKWMNFVTKTTQKYNHGVKVAKNIKPLFNHLMAQPANPRICEFHCPWCPQEHLSYVNNKIKKRRGATRSIDRKEIHSLHLSSQKFLMKVPNCKCSFCGVFIGFGEIQAYTNMGCTSDAVRVLIDNLFIKRISELR